MEAAKRMFARSVENRRLRYGTMLCDWDSKACVAVKDRYEGIEVKKEDFINHISKRMFNGLQTKEIQKKKELDRKLTAPMMQKITNTYATNLKRGAPNVEDMKLYMLGGIFHMRHR